MVIASYPIPFGSAREDQAPLRQVAASEDGRKILALGTTHKNQVYCIDVGGNGNETSLTLPAEVKQLHYISTSDVLLSVAGESASLWLVNIDNAEIIAKFGSSATQI